VRVLLVNNLYAPHSVGGAERSVQALAEGLRELGVEPFVLCLGTASEPEQSVLNGIRVLRFPLRNRHWPFQGGARPALARLAWHLKDRWNSAARIDVASALDEVRPNIVHTHNLAGFSIAAWAEARAHRLPLVHTLRDYYLLCPRSTMFDVSRGAAGRNCARPCASCRLLRRAHPEAATQVDRVVSISESLWRSHVEHEAFKSDTPVEVIRNGIALPTIERVPRAAGGPVRLGFIGRVHPSKGVDLLLDAVGDPRLRGRVTLLVAGTGEPDYMSALQTRAQGLAVELAGRMAPQEFYRVVDAVVVPSIWQEPLSRVVPEAHTCGLPVVASRRGGLPEIVTAGETGELFDPALEGDLARALLRLIEDGARLAAMSARAREVAVQYEPARVSREYLRLYESLL
jgi:glycogen(starch) synthase